MRALVIGTLAALPFGLPAVANAQSETPVCAATPAAPPTELAAWSRPSKAKAAASAASLASSSLLPGATVEATLLPADRTRFAVPPERPVKAGTFGGLFAFSVKRAGTYRVALGAAAWIDVVRGRTVVASISHGHGPDCTGIRKMVDFPLQPGGYVLQLSGNDTPAIRLLVAPLP